MPLNSEYEPRANYPTGEKLTSHHLYVPEYNVLPLLQNGDNVITVPRQNLHPTNVLLDGHNDHRIVMALSVLLSQLGGTIDGAQAVRKSYPGFFDDIKALGVEVDYQ